MFSINSHLFLRPFRSFTSTLKCSIESAFTGLRQVRTKAVKESSPNEVLQNNLTVIDEGQLDELYRFCWIKCSSHDTAVLDSYEQFLKMTAKYLDIDYIKTEEPHRTIKRRTLLASRHVHKKYRVQYETRSYYRNLLFKNITGSTAKTFLEYVERNIPEGLLFVAEKYRLAELPFELEKNNK